MRMIATLQEPDAGAITLGYLPQEFGVYPKVSAEHLLDHVALLESIRGHRTVADGLHPRLYRVGGDRRDPLSASVPIRLINSSCGRLLV